MKQMKHWYSSKTIWIAIGQLLIIWASFISGDVGFNTTMALSMTFLGGVINRFYTNQDIKKK